uniref:Tetratricopeptide repeat protein n=1 Tax=Piliocolobus tephrosceles TaxID=591936 RepID=A0A8C9LJ03_9PRIM
MFCDEEKCYLIETKDETMNNKIIGNDNKEIKSEDKKQFELKSSVYNTNINKNENYIKKEKTIKSENISNDINNNMLHKNNKKCESDFNDDYSKEINKKNEAKNNMNHILQNILNGNNNNNNKDSIIPPTTYHNDGDKKQNENNTYEQLTNSNENKKNDISLFDEYSKVNRNEELNGNMNENNINTNNTKYMTFLNKTENNSKLLNSNDVYIKNEDIIKETCVIDKYSTNSVNNEKKNGITDEGFNGKYIVNASNVAYDNTTPTTTTTTTTTTANDNTTTNSTTLNNEKKEYNEEVINDKSGPSNQDYHKKVDVQNDINDKVKDKKINENINNNIRNYYSDNCIDNNNDSDDDSSLSDTFSKKSNLSGVSNQSSEDKFEESDTTDNVGTSPSSFTNDLEEEENSSYDSESIDEYSDDSNNGSADPNRDDSDSSNYNSDYYNNNKYDYNIKESDRFNTKDILYEKSAEEIKNIGNDYFKKCDYTNAIFYYSKALKKCKEKEMKSIIYSNRAACNVLIKNWNAVIDDCTKSIKYNNNYIKSYIRRSNAYEQLEKYNDSINDLDKALSLDPSLLKTYEIKQKKLKTLAEQQLNKEKEEMVGKLKDFGNMLLGKVGLSLDNFEVQKNPNNDGSFNIQFKQNK